MSLRIKEAAMYVLYWSHQMQLLQTIPGVGPMTAQVIVAETGADMTRFPTAGHLAA